MTKHLQKVLQKEFRDGLGVILLLEEELNAKPPYVA